MRFVARFESPILPFRPAQVSTCEGVRYRGAVSVSVRVRVRVKATVTITVTVRAVGVNPASASYRETPPARTQVSAVSRYRLRTR